MDIVTRQQARELSLPRYFTGEPCQNGHVVKRRTANGQCVECRREHAQRTRHRWSMNKRAAKQAAKAAE